jgi:hypothetical protein
MKKNLIILLLLALPMLSISQNYDIPKDERGIITFEKIITVENKTQKELYLLARTWFAEKFRSANNVIQMDNEESGVIIGKGSSEIYIVAIGIPVKFTMYFTLKIFAREGRSRLILTDIYYENYNEGKLIRNSAEDMMLSKKSLRKDGTPKNINNQYREQTIASKQKIFKSIENSLTGDTFDESAW